MSPCKHENITPWDCACYNGCSSCSVRGHCTDCGATITDHMQKSAHCKVCGLDFPSKTQYRKHLNRGAHKRARLALLARLGLPLTANVTTEK